MITNLNELPEFLAKAVVAKGGIHECASPNLQFDEHLFKNAIIIFEQLTEQANHRYFYNAGRELKFGIIKSDYVGAFASAGKGDVDFIGVNYGTIHLLSSLFSRLLSSELIFPDVGMSNTETREGYSFYIPRIADSGKFEARRPNCSVRLAFAKHMALTALTFIYSHEISHITKGHSRVKNSIKDGFRPPLSVLENQALELDADLGAIELTYDYMQFMKAVEERLNLDSDAAIKESWLNFYKSPIHNIRFVFFASYLPFRIHCDNHWDPETQAKNGQPQPPFRMGMLMKSFATVLQEACGLSEEKSKELVYRFSLESEKAYADIQAESGEGELDLKAIDAFFENVGEYGITVVEAFEKIEDELKSGALIEKLCPSPDEAQKTSYVAIAGAKLVSPYYAIIESRRCEKIENTLQIQCFSVNRVGEKPLQFSIAISPNFEGNPVTDLLKTEALEILKELEEIDFFEPIELAALKEQDALIEWAFGSSNSVNLKLDIKSMME
ncbi:hypothetical protein [Pseudomonas sp. ICMP 8385]|uniref:hypothetical protein n=1 Tax=Pseudomonas sp. ICMP 8385 TaxID=1718920 RepID=UPI00114605D0|nr:hypothetical protein [Pseudomonas sp. ICMP 8385]